MRGQLLFLTLLFASSCGGGGGSGEHASMISGTWRGEFTQEAIVCTDQTESMRSSATRAGEVVLEVSGTDVLGTVVRADDGNCVYEGLRVESGFSALALDGCNDGVQLDFTLLQQENAARVFYGVDFSKFPPTLPDGSPFCASVMIADLFR